MGNVLSVTIGWVSWCLISGMASWLHLTWPFHPTAVAAWNPAIKSFSSSPFIRTHFLLRRRFFPGCVSSQGLDPFNSPLAQSPSQISANGDLLVETWTSQKPNLKSKGFSFLNSNLKTVHTVLESTEGLLGNLLKCHPICLEALAFGSQKFRHKDLEDEGQWRAGSYCILLSFISKEAGKGWKRGRGVIPRMKTNQQRRHRTTLSLASENLKY